MGSRKITFRRGCYGCVPLGLRHIFLEAELDHALLVGGDGGALNAHAVLLDGLRRVNCDLVVGLVALLDAEVVIHQVNVEVGKDEAVLDELPDDARHLIAIELNDGVMDLDLFHVRSVY